MLVWPTFIKYLLFNRMPLLKRKLFPMSQQPVSKKKALERIFVFQAVELNFITTEQLVECIEQHDKVEPPVPLLTICKQMKYLTAAQVNHLMSKRLDASVAKALAEGLGTVTKTDKTKTADAISLYTAPLQQMMPRDEREEYDRLLQEKDKLLERGQKQREFLKRKFEESEVKLNNFETEKNEEFEKKQHEIETLESELTCYKGLHEQSEGKMKTLRESIEKTEALFTREKHKSNGLLNLLEQGGDELVAAEEKRQKAEIELEKDQKELEYIQGKLDKESKERIELKKSSQEADEITLKLEKEIQQIKSQYGSIGESQEKLTEELKNSEAEKQQLQEEKEKLSKELQKEREKLSREQEKISKEQEKLKQNLTSLEKEHKQKQDFTLNLEEQFQKKQSELEEQKQRQTQLEDQLEKQRAIEKQLKEQEEQQQKLQKQLDNLEKEKQSLNKKMSQSEEKYKEAQKQSEAVVEQLRQEKNRLQDDFESEKASMEENFHKEKISLEGNISQYKQKSVTLESKLEKYQKSLKNWQEGQDTENVKNQIEQERKNRIEMEKQKRDLEQKLKEAEKKIDFYRQVYIEGELETGTSLPGSDEEYYIIQKVLGRGGMGVAYSAIRGSDQEIVVVKTLIPEAMSDLKLLMRFVQEARTMLSFDHENVVTSFDFQQGREMSYFIMEYLDGDSVEDMLEEQGFLDVVEATEMALGISRALQYLEENFLVHRDVKPSNIIVNSNGVAKLVDFGIVKMTDRVCSLTTEGIILGTPYYLSPEQTYQTNVDIRSDIYCLGTTYYHMVVGEVPFPGDNPIDVIQKRLVRSPKPGKVKPDLPKPVCNIIEKMMNRNIKKRHDTAAHLVVDMENVLKKIK